ncbi:MAG: c-type cytochrome [Pseudomonas sp.]
MNLLKKILLTQATLLSLWAVGAQAASNDEIAARIKPVGEVCIQGQECKGIQAAAAGAAAGGARSGSAIVATYCGACHTPGILGAPKIGDSAAWTARAEKVGGVDGLLASAIKGINSMPPKGTCSDCTDDELKGAIKEMSGL